MLIVITSRWFRYGSGGKVGLSFQTSQMYITFQTSFFLYFRQNNSQKNKLQVSEEIFETFIPCFSNLKIENCAVLLINPLDICVGI